MLYLDANVFVYPILHSGPKSDAAAKLLGQVESGHEPAATASLAIDEVVWVVGKNAGREAALRAGRLMLDLPNLRILPVREAELRLALDLMQERRSLSPRDAVHAACALNSGVFTIVSDDEDFDELDGLERRPLA